MRSDAQRRVLIIQSQVKQYRVPFFETLRSALAEDDITLRVAYSDPPRKDRAKKDNCELPADYGIKVKAYWAFGERIVWQPVLDEVTNADLVIVEQANKYVMNHFLLFSAAFGLKKLAFWGLGENKEASQLPISEWYRRKTLRLPDWWFAYTKGTAQYLVRQGVPQERITPVQNAVDTRELRAQIAAIEEVTISEERRKLGIPTGARVGVFCGMLDPVKAIPFLIESAKLVRNEIPNFHLIIAGGGPDARPAQDAAHDSGGWIHAVGPAFGTQKALLLKMGDVFMLPGRVGLAVLDAFAVGLPLLTTEIPIHGPEAEYLEPGVNGLMTEHSIEAYSKAVIDLLRDPSHLHALREGAAKSANRYSIEAMASNFRRGIMRCLNAATRETA